MKVRSVTIENCKSYKNAESFSLEADITLLVGPNAGGKSNTMDILAVVLRKYFLESYQIIEGQYDGVIFWDIQRANIFHPLPNYLDKNLEREKDAQQIKIILEVGNTDVDNVHTILEHRDDLGRALAKYRNKPIADLGFLDGWSADMFAVGNTADFTVNDGNIVSAVGISDKFREYLRHLSLFILLARDLPHVVLAPTFLYFSPYRSANPQDLNATLASDNYVNLLHQYNQTTSRGTTSLIKLATLFFAEKKRRMEECSSDQAYGRAWEEDKDVKSATSYMQRLGYEWNLKLVDGNKNIYEIELRKDTRRFPISQASSGEKEILNFLFGIFALRTRGGLLVIDEPELHLHPRWQAILHDLFRELAHSTENQFLLSTHSPVFITPDTIASVRRVAKDKSGSTRMISLQAGGNDRSPKSLLHLVNSHNNERVFFADKVILVEGIQDRLVFDGLVSRYREAAKIGAVIETLEVHGKANFERYRDFLEALRVPRYIVGDLDYGVDLKASQIGDLVEIPYPKIDKDILKDKKSQDRRSLAEALREAIETNDTKTLVEIWKYIEGRFARLKKNMTDPEKKKLQHALKELREQDIFILDRGEIEDYLPSKAKSVDGTIRLLEPVCLLKWLRSINDNPELKELEGIVVHTLGIRGEDLAEVRANVLSRLKEDIPRTAETSESDDAREEDREI